MQPVTWPGGVLGVGGGGQQSERPCIGDGLAHAGGGGAVMSPDPDPDPDPASHTARLACSDCLSGIFTCCGPWKVFGCCHGCRH